MAQPTFAAAPTMPMEMAAPPAYAAAPTTYGMHPGVLPTGESMLMTPGMPQFQFTPTGAEPVQQQFAAPPQQAPAPAVAAVQEQPVPEAAEKKPTGKRDKKKPGKTKKTCC